VFRGWFSFEDIMTEEKKQVRKLSHSGLSVYELNRRYLENRRKERDEKRALKEKVMEAVEAAMAPKDAPVVTQQTTNKPKVSSHADTLKAKAAKGKNKK